MSRSLRKRSVVFCSIIFNLVFAGYISTFPGQPNVTASASIDTSDYLIGDWIDIEVLLEHPAGTRFTSLTGDTLGPFLVLEKDLLRQLSANESVAGYRIAVYDTGKVTVPPFEFICSLPDDTTQYELVTAPVDLTIHSIPVDTTSDIHDIKPPLSLSRTWQEVAITAGIIILVLFLVWQLYRYLKRRGGREELEIEEIEKRPPHILAKERLKEIEERRLWQQGLFKPYYSEVTETIRDYLNGRYGLPALELTTYEILREIESTDIPSEARKDLQTMLSLADLVKFAKYRVLPEENSETMELAYLIVDRTAEANDVENDQDEVKEAEYVSS